jgi:TPP-dependent 2-oxoacid decarboxylase
MIGAMLTDGNTAGHTVRLDPGKTITIDHHRTTVRNRPELPGCHWGFETVNPVVAQ